jgi:hypothetical protein
VPLFPVGGRSQHRFLFIPLLRDSSRNAMEHDILFAAGATASYTANQDGKAWGASFVCFRVRG